MHALVDDFAPGEVEFVELVFEGVGDLAVKADALGRQRALHVSDHGQCFVLLVGGVLASTEKLNEESAVLRRQADDDIDRCVVSAGG